MCDKDTNKPNIKANSVGFVKNEVSNTKSKILTNKPPEHHHKRETSHFYFTPYHILPYVTRVRVCGGPRLAAGRESKPNMQDAINTIYNQPHTRASVGRRLRPA